MKNDERMFSYGFGAGFGAAIVLGAAAFGIVKLVEHIADRRDEGCCCCDGELCEELEEELTEGAPNDPPEVSDDIVKKSVNAFEDVTASEFSGNVGNDD